MKEWHLCILWLFPQNLCCRVRAADKRSIISPFYCVFQPSRLLPNSSTQMVQKSQGWKYIWEMQKEPPESSGMHLARLFENLFALPLANNQCPTSHSQSPDNNERHEKAIMLCWITGPNGIFRDIYAKVYTRTGYAYFGQVLSVKLDIQTHSNLSSSNFSYKAIITPPVLFQMRSSQGYPLNHKSFSVLRWLFVCLSWQFLGVFLSNLSTNFGKAFTYLRLI